MIDEFENVPAKRPAFLTVLCILTFISTGFSLLAGIVQLIIGPMSEEAILKTRVDTAEAISEMKELGWDSFETFLRQAQALAEDIQANFYIAVAVAIIGPAIGLYGAIKMWKGSKLGFHLYIIYNLIAVGGVYLYAQPSNIPSMSIIFGLIISGAFIFMYSRNLHWMK